MTTTLDAAEYRPALRQRRFGHDSLVSLDLFSGFGGLTKGIEMAGFDVRMAANHNRYKVEVHEANHPTTEHWIADLANEDAPNYHSARDLPRADLLTAGVSCVNHSMANTVRAYERQQSLLDFDDPVYEAAVTRSERDRATANCVLHYAAVHHPRVILVECTTQLQSWGTLIPGTKKVGDGSTYRWWLQQFESLGYRHRVLFLNSQFFGVGQSRDRGYWVFWDKRVPSPDLDHRPVTWCARCDAAVEAVQVWKTGIPPSGTVRWGQQYCYRCPSCRTEVVPPFTPSLDAIDLSDLGKRIGDRDKPLKAATAARAERCRQRFADFPAVLMPAKATHGTEKHPWQPMATQTSQQETAILSTGAVIGAAGNTFERAGSTCRTRDLSQPLPTQTATNGTALLTPPLAIQTANDGVGEDAVLLGVANFQGSPRGADEPLPTQCGSETFALVSAGIVPFRKHTIPASHAEPGPTITADQTPGLLTAQGAVTPTIPDPHRVARGGQGALFAEWLTNGPSGDAGAGPGMGLSGALVGCNDFGALSGGVDARWRAALAEISLDDCHFRMMSPTEIGRASGFDVAWQGSQGTFTVWGSARAQVDGYGNAVTPSVGHWIGLRLSAALHRDVDAP